MATGYVDANGVRLFYERAGQGRSLILAHAAIADHRMWDDQWNAFTQRYDTIRYDMRTFGKSERGEGDFSPVDDLLGLMDALEVERTALLGCSMGGEAVIDLALAHPERVRALIPVGAVPSGFDFQGEPPPLEEELQVALKAGDFKRAAEINSQMFVDGPFRTKEQSRETVRRRMIEMNLGSLPNMRFMMQHWQPPAQQAAQNLASIDIPTLVIVGAVDESELVRAAGVMADGIPNAQKLVIPDAAHLPNMEHPQQFTDAVVTFLDGIR